MKESAEVPKADEDDWFSTPSHQPRSPSPMIVDPGSTREIVHLSPDHTLSSAEGSHSSISRSSSVADPRLTTAKCLPQQPPSNVDASLVQPDTLNNAVPLSKKERKRLKKAQRALERAASSTTIPPPPAASSVSSVECIHEEQTNSSLSPPTSHPPGSDAVSGPSDVAVQPELLATPGFQAGLITSTVSPLV